MAKVYSLSGLIPSFLNNALASILRDKEIFFYDGKIVQFANASS